MNMKVYLSNGGNMRILILGAGGFIGKNLVSILVKDSNNELFLFDLNNLDYFLNYGKNNIKIINGNFTEDYDFDKITEGIDVVFHLISSTTPSTSNKRIDLEMKANIIVTIKLIEACVKNNVNRVIFLSSGGTVYGKEACKLLKEDCKTYPISSYGIQKITIEKLLYLYNYLYGLDYRVIRLANPFGPYQNPNTGLGVITTFLYRALKNETIQVFGDGSVVRDYIYIDDAIKGIINISFDKLLYNRELSKESNLEECVYNLGSGQGNSINNVIDTIEKVLNRKVDVQYIESRKVDVPYNVLDISRYENRFGKLNPLYLEEGIIKLSEFMKKEYKF